MGGGGGATLLGYGDPCSKLNSISCRLLHEVIQTIFFTFFTSNPLAQYLKLS